MYEKKVEKVIDKALGADLKVKWIKSISPMKGVYIFRPFCTVLPETSLHIGAGLSDQLG